ncbi:MAG: 3-oxoacyl-[acyl-carrier-protein] reductase [Phycisphaerales bacterium]|nr:3-oxoacyl-[acyl-carrier-protein] reductase [Phycisphaerales bacterium]
MFLKDQIALVSGASRGIGRAICESLAREGALVYAAARNLDAIHSWVAEAPGVKAQIVPVALDVTNRAACDKVVDDIAARHEHLDILVNNAGITKDGLLMTMEDDQFDAVLNTNLKGAFYLMRAASRYMVRARRGRIINISSFSGLSGNAGQANYAAAKAGMNGLTKSVAKELAKRGVLCNAIAPGFIETDMTDVLPDKVKETVKPLIPMQRFGSAAEIASVVRFLAGPDASYITGQVLSVDGGLHM